MSDHPIDGSGKAQSRRVVTRDLQPLPGKAAPLPGHSASSPQREHKWGRASYEKAQALKQKHAQGLDYHRTAVLDAWDREKPDSDMISPCGVEEFERELQIPFRRRR